MDPILGIDFGTTNSVMACYNPKTGQAEVLLNAEGEPKTPSAVYVGANEVLVGKIVLEDKLHDTEESRKVILSCKRYLQSNTMLALASRRITYVEAATHILKKLKQDAEELQFHTAVNRAVVTCPAAFGELERERICSAAKQAGFAEVHLLEEPVAAAIAYARAGLQVGQHILVYDLGGGTFDLAVLQHEGDTDFRLALEPRGLRACGGDDFDRALYDYLEGRIRAQGIQIPESSLLDLNRLLLCRKCKESLSVSTQSLFSAFIGFQQQLQRFQERLERKVFEGLIQERIGETVRLTQILVADAREKGHTIDTVVLIGGSAKLPLVDAKLAQALPVSPRRWQHQEVAVALGAAYFANELWGEAKSTRPKATLQGSTSSLKSNSAPAAPSQLVTTLSANEDVDRVLFSPDGCWLAAERDCKKAIKLWDVANGWALRTLRGHDDGVNTLAFSPDGRFLASGDEEGDVILWTMNNSVENRTLYGHYSDEVNTVVFSPDGRLLAAGDDDGDITLWNVENGECTHRINAKDEIYKLAFSPDGCYLIALDDSKKIKIWPITDNLERHSLPKNQNDINLIAISPNSRFLASADEEGYIRLWDFFSNQEVFNLQWHSGTVNSLVFSPDGRLLASAGDDAIVKLWDIYNKTELHTLRGHDAEHDTFEHRNFFGRVISGTYSYARGAVMSIAFSPYGHYLASGSRDGFIKLWDVASGRELHTLVGHTSSVNSVAFSPDGRFLASGSSDETIKIWK